MYKIKNKEGKMIFEGESLRGVDLEGADLEGANLRGEDLRGAYLRGANLGGTDLRGVDLRDAYLGGANLEGAKGLKSLQTDIWTAYITKTHIKIGCKYHTHAEWKRFTLKEISFMGHRALKWWKENKKVIMLLAGQLAK